MEIEKILKSNGTSLSNWKKMPKPFRDVTDSQIFLILDELSYNREELREEHDRDILKMTDEQRKIYKEIMDAVIGKRGGVFFVYGFGGTGKTFLWRLLSAAIRSRGEIVLNVASSGIALLLLQGGRTAHSRFGEEIIYLSSDSIDPSDTRSVNDQALTPDFLNSIKASDNKLQFKMRRRQLPISVAFAITINKSQGQSLSHVGIFLPRPVFSHGQLYVAISRVTSKKGLKILIVDEDGKPQKQTRNVVLISEFIFYPILCLFLFHRQVLVFHSISVCDYAQTM
uniref:ATP-dependent DNA helicase n=1 Tax=Brassica oleracea var. oleracea TaxID=109376 RepID=A0A0D3EA48_BRAOL